MTPSQRARIEARHRDSLTRHGHHPHALYWSSREVQELRFAKLAEIGIQSGDCLLDVGCGFGDLRSWLLAQGIEVGYSGLDLSPDLLAEAGRLHPDVIFHHGDLFDLAVPEHSFDWIFLSGALNEQLHDGGDYARATLARMFALCRKGVALNLLDARHGPTAAAHDLQSFLPQEMVAFCQRLGAQVDLIEGYLPNDFTLHLRR